LAALPPLWLYGASIRSALSIAAATIELLTRIELDKDFVDARRKFLDLAKTNAISSYASTEKKDSEETGQIKLILNLYELVAIGVRRGTLDYWIWRRYFRKGTITFWEYGVPFINELRTLAGNEAIYKEFEWLKKRMDSRLPPIGGYFWGQWF
jgi:hypothetical protein